MTHSEQEPRPKTSRIQELTGRLLALIARKIPLNPDFTSLVQEQQRPEAERNNHES